MIRERVGDGHEKKIRSIPVLFKKDIHPSTVEGPAVVVRVENELHSPTGVTKEEYFDRIKNKLRIIGIEKAKKTLGFSGEKQKIIEAWESNAEDLIGLAEFAQEEFTKKDIQEGKDDPGMRKNKQDETVTHSLWITDSLLELGIEDMNALRAAILHDVDEDTDVTLDQIEEMTNSTVRSYVQSLTKVKSDEVEGKFIPANKDPEDVAAEQTGRRLVEGAIQHSVVVSAIKGLDALHNHMTDKALPKHRREERRELTEVFYRPWVNANGFNRIEDLLGEQIIKGDKPDTYNWIRHFQRNLQKKTLTDKLVEIGSDWLQVMSEEMNNYGLEQPYVEISYPSIYETYKRSRKGAIFEEHVLPRMKVVCEDELHLRQCNGAVSRVQKNITVDDERFEQDLENHGSVIRKIPININGTTHDIEVEFTTSEREIVPADRVLHPDMDIGYQAIAKDKLDIKRRTYGEIASEQSDVRPRMSELAQEQMYYYDPEGSTHLGPVNMTALDGAYWLGPGLGWDAICIEVNGTKVPLNTRLNNGDQVEVFSYSSESKNDKQIINASRYDQVTTEYSIAQIHKAINRQKTKLTEEQTVEHEQIQVQRGKVAVDSLFREMTGQKLKILFNYAPTRDQIVQKYSEGEQEQNLEHFFQQVGKLPISLHDDRSQNGDYHTSLPERWREMVQGNLDFMTEQELDTARDAYDFVESLIRFHEEAPAIRLFLQNVPGRLEAIGRITSQSGGDVQPIGSEAENIADLGFHNVLAVNILFLDYDEETVGKVVKSFFDEFPEARVFELKNILEKQPPLEQLEEILRNSNK